MSTEVTLPVLDESVTESTISRWFKAVSETVEVDEPPLEVSINKVDIEIPSSVAGTLLEIGFNEDDVAEIGAVLAVIGEASEASAPQTAPALQPVVEVAPAPAPAPAPAASPASATPQAVPAGNATKVVFPVLGESVTEGTVSRWLKAVGEIAEVDEPLLEVSTDKMDTETPSSVVDTFLEIRVAENETTTVGAVLVLVGDTVVAPPTSAPAVPPVPVVIAPAAAPAASAASVTARRASADEGVYVTPLVHKLATEHGVSLSSVQGIGVGGRTRKQDILDAVEVAKKAASAPAPTVVAVTNAPTTAIPQVAAVSEEAAKLRGTTEKLSRIRKVTAERMTESLRMTPQLTTTVEMDVTIISRLRRVAEDELKKRKSASLSYLPFITKATIEALKTALVLNVSADFEAGTVTYVSQEDIGIAVDTDRGLMAPVIQDAGDLNLARPAKCIGDLATRARVGKVGPDELSGGTFTITNYGSTGTLFDTPITSPSQVVILGTGVLVKRPVVVTDALGGDTIAIRDMMYLPLTYDHRLIDGAKAVRLLNLIKARPEVGDFAGDLGL